MMMLRVFILLNIYYVSAITLNCLHKNHVLTTHVVMPKSQNLPVTNQTFPYLKILFSMYTPYISNVIQNLGLLPIAAVSV